VDDKKRECRNENVGECIVEDLLSRLELEHLGLSKTMSPIETWENNPLTSETHDVAIRYHFFNFFIFLPSFFVFKMAQTR
jgi:hypothetical protein